MSYLTQAKRIQRVVRPIGEMLSDAWQERRALFEAESRDAVLLARRAGIEPDGWQCEALRSQAQQMILLCSRQSGKSMATSLLSLHTALYKAASLVLLIAPALRQSAELFATIRQVYGAINGARISPVVEESALRMRLMNGSRIICLPGSKPQNIRGYSGVSLLVFDEAAFGADVTYNSLRPMLAVSRGRLVLLSSPFGKRGFFHQEWMEGGDDWHRLTVTAHDCPRISAAWLEAERRRIGDWWFNQEYLCQFVEASDQIFSDASIAAALDAGVHPLEWFT